MSELLKINVNDHTERKGQLTYLSWAWAWAEVLKIDPGAVWEAHEKDGLPVMFLPDASAMVKVSVTIKGDRKTCLLPVMDNRNKAIKNPDSFAINTAIMRCMAKCIAMHGLGLYIYAGEDLPESDEPVKPAPKELPTDIRHKPTDGAGSTLSEERKAEIDEIALYLIDCHTAGKDMDACRIWYAGDTFADNDERVYCWSLLGAESKLRSMLKANKPTGAQAAERMAA